MPPRSPALALGNLSYDAGSPRVDGQTVYDLASLTKVLCTTTLALGLVERGAIGLDDLVARGARSGRATIVNR